MPDARNVYKRLLEFKKVFKRPNKVRSWGIEDQIPKKFGQIQDTTDIIACALSLYIDLHQQNILTNF